MRRHGWQLPYHPLQVVAISVFLALGFAFYVFFLPFVGRKLFQYLVMGLYTPLVTCVFCLFVWCAATDPADSGVFKCDTYRNIEDNVKQTHSKLTGKESELISSINEAQAGITGDKPLDQVIGIDGVGKTLSRRPNREISSCSSLKDFFGWCTLSFLRNQQRSHEQSSDQQASEDGMFYCSLCKVEVFKYSKHCRVCDKCVDGFDHHCRWLNNCVGKKNYRRFFILMVSALLLLILQWSIGVLVLTLCFLERKQFSVEISSNLGSSFSLVPFVVVVASCTFLAMVATIPLTQLFFFHVLLIRKGISTYDYIVALREQELQDAGGLQSPQLSPISSLTGLSTASSFPAIQRSAWCTPPRFFFEDQFDAFSPESGTFVNPVSKGMTMEESLRMGHTAPVKISPWTLARLNAEEVSKVAAQARKKSKILQPVGKLEMPMEQETDLSSFGGSSGRMTPKLDARKHHNKRGRLPIGHPLRSLANMSLNATDCNLSDLAPGASTSLAPLQLEARSAFKTSRAMSSTGIVTSSPDGSLDSPDLHPFRVSSSGTEEAQGLTSLPFVGYISQKGIQLSRSTSDGYDASGGEDSDRVSSRIVHRSSDWTSLFFDSEQGDMAGGLKALPSARQQA